MSLLGKILALLNIFGALGLVTVAMLDYGKRQSWAYSYYRHELVLEGLPLPIPPNERDPANSPIDDRITEALSGELFNDLGGSPVMTQTQEVERIQTLLDARLQAAQGKPAQAHLLARILLPLADNYSEREQMFACRAYFGTDVGVKSLQKRCEDAYREAQRPAPDGQPEKSIGEAFRLAFHTQGGEPAEYFTLILLTKLLDKNGKPTGMKVDAAFDAAVEAQRASLEARYRQLFEDARGTSDKMKSDTPSSVFAQRAAVARLLFGVSPFLAQEEILADPEKGKLLTGPSDRATYQAALLETEPYRLHIRRTYVVCGLKASLEAISERAAVLRSLSGYVQQSFGQERLQFLFDHAAIIEQLREQAAIVREEQSQIAGNQKKLSDYEQIVRLRQKELDDLSADLAKSREETTKEIAKLRDLSENVLGLRLRVRDAIRDNEFGERRIRELEQKILELER